VKYCSRECQKKVCFLYHLIYLFWLRGSFNFFCIFISYINIFSNILFI
jgi:hypothetical protein